MLKVLRDRFCILHYIQILSYLLRLPYRHAVWIFLQLLIGLYMHIQQFRYFLLMLFSF